MVRLETTWCDVPIGRLRVRTAGSGPTLMFTHGLLVDGRIWDEVAGRVVAQGYSVVLPDLPLGAHTVAAADRASLTTTAVAACLFDTADRLDVERFALLGFDTGGAIAQVAAASRPDRVDRLALMSCDAFEQFPPAMIKPLAWAARWGPAMTLVLRSLGDPRLQRGPLPLALLAKRRIDPSLVRAWARPCATDREVRADCVAFIAQMDAADTLAAAEELRRFHGPSMVLWSRQDRIFPRRTRTASLPSCLTAFSHRSEVSDRARLVPSATQRASWRFVRTALGSMRNQPCIAAPRISMRCACVVWTSWSDSPGSTRTMMPPWLLAATAILPATRNARPPIIFLSVRSCSPANSSRRRSAMSSSWAIAHRKGADRFSPARSFAILDRVSTTPRRASWPHC